MIFFTIDVQIGHDNQENEADSHLKAPPVHPLTQWHVVESVFDLCSAGYSSLFNVKVKVHLMGQARPGQAGHGRKEGWS